MKKYIIIYRGEETWYPPFEVENAESALMMWAKDVERNSDETIDEILNEEWTSPRGVEKCAIARLYEEN